MSKGKAGGTYGDAEDWPKKDKGKDRDQDRDKDHTTPGGQAPEKVGDRPNVSTVKPEDYPKEQRKDSQP